MSSRVCLPVSVSSLEVKTASSPSGSLSYSWLEFIQDIIKKIPFPDCNQNINTENISQSVQLLSCKLKKHRILPEIFSCYSTTNDNPNLKQIILQKLKEAWYRNISSHYQAVVEIALNNQWYTEEEKMDFALKLVEYHPVYLSKIFSQLNLLKEERRYKLAYEIFKNVSEIFLNEVLERLSSFKLSKEKLIELCEYIAKGYGGFKVNVRQICSLELEEDRIHLALYTAQYHAISHVIENYEIYNQDALIKIILQHIKYKHITNVCANFKKYTIEGEDIRFAIALELAKYNWNAVGLNIQNFDITCQKYLVRLADIVCSKSPDIFVKVIQNFHITRKKRMYQYALHCIKYQSISAYIQGFIIPGSKYNFAIANSITYEKDFPYIVQHFQLSEEETRFSLACQKARLDPNILYQTIQNFKIQNPELLYNIALICVQNTKPGCLVNLEFFEKLNSQQRLTLLNIAIENKLAVSLHFSSFNVQDPDIRFEIAKRVIKNRVELISRYIPNYNIPDEAKRFEILLEALEINPQDVCTSISFYELTNQKYLVCAAKKCLGLECLASEFNHFGIRDAIERLRIASEVFIKYPRKLAEHFENFCIVEETDRSFLAFQLIKENLNLADYIVSYNLSVESRKRLARIVADKNPSYLIKNIQNFKIDDPDYNFEIAKEIMISRPHEIARNLKHFKIQNKERLFIILKHLVQQAPRTTLRRIKYYRCLDIYQIIELFLIGLSINPTKIISYLQMKIDLKIENQSKLSAFQNLVFNICRMKKMPNLVYLKNALEVCGKQLDLNITPVLDSLLYTKNNDEIIELPYFVSYRNLLWLLKAICKLHGSSLFSNWKDNKIIVENVLTKCSVVHNPMIRELVRETCWHALDNKVIILYIQKTKVRVHLFLALIVSSILLLKGLSEEEVTSLIEKLKNFKNDSKRYNFKYAYFTFIDICFKKLTREDILYWLNRVFKDTYGIKECINILTIIKNIYHIGGSLTLSDPSSAANSEDLNQYLQKIFTAKIPIDDFSDFSQKYENSFGSSRFPMAAMIYASGLNNLKQSKAKALKNFAMYMSWTLNGKEYFKTMRMDEKLNFHLKTIFEKFPDLKVRWMTSYAEKVVFQNNSLKINKNFNLKHFLHLKLVQDKHFVLPKLEAFLLGLEYKESYENENIERVAAEDILIESIKHGFENYDKNQTVNIIESVISLLKLTERQPFYHDLIYIRKVLFSKFQSTQHLLLTFDDDPIDLLLCGTEVEDSCQSIHRNEEYNKGLLGYLLDGKNRLIAIKQVSGEIVSRALLRLLWDKTNKKPVLLLSRIYPTQIAIEYQYAILNMAKRIAKDMGLDLVSKEVIAGKKYPYLIKSYGGPAKFEYVDEVCGVVNGGKYTLFGCRYLQQYKDSAVKVKKNDNKDIKDKIG